MRLIIIAIISLLFIYIYSQRCWSNRESFSNEGITKSNYESPSYFNILNTEKVKPIFTNGGNEQTPGWDSNDSNIYSNKYWVVKNKGFSDIYNYEDLGGGIINSVADELIPFIKKKTIDDANKGIHETKEGSFPQEVLYKNSEYSLLGIATNPYFEQYYLIYEHEVKSDLTYLKLEEETDYITNNKIYEYILAKLDKNKPSIQHYIGPRVKINIGDVVYLSLGTFQLGPLLVSKFNKNI